METEYIIITEYINNSEIEPQFILLLVDEGLISTQLMGGEQCLHISQLPDIERYARWYYELNINIEGIDIIQRLLLRMEHMQKELATLRKAFGKEIISDDITDEYHDML